MLYWHSQLMPVRNKYLQSPKCHRTPANEELFSWLHLHDLEKKHMYSKYIRTGRVNIFRLIVLWKKIHKMDSKSPKFTKTTLRNVVCFLLGNFPASEFYMPTFRNTLSVPTSQAGRYFFIPTCLRRWNRQCVLKCWHCSCKGQIY